MLSNFNKKVLLAISFAFFGYGVSSADEGSNLMNHSIQAGAEFNYQFNDSKDALEKVVLGENNKLKSESSFLFEAGASLKYVYNINSMFGVGANVRGGYAKLGSFSLEKEENATKTNEEKKAIDAKDLINYSGFYVNPSLRLVVNFLPEGLTFDEENECAAGLKLAGIVDLGWNFNFAKLEAGDNVKNLIEESEVEAKKNVVVKTLGGFAFGVGAEAVLPCGLGFDLMYRGNFAEPFEVKSEEVKPVEEGKKTTNDKKKCAYNQEIGAGVFFDFGSLLF